MLLAGSILIMLSSQVKLPSLLALGFVTMALAYRLGGNLRALLLAGGGMAALSVAVMALVGWASGLGFGWIYTLGTANVVRSWMSPPTLLALGTGQVGILLGLGDHTTAVLGADPFHRRADHHGVGDLAAAGRLPRPAASDRRPRRRAGHLRAAVSRRAAVVSAVGDHSAGRAGRPARVSGWRSSSSPSSSASSARRPTATDSRCSRSWMPPWRALHRGGCSSR